MCVWSERDDVSAVADFRRLLAFPPQWSGYIPGQVRCRIVVFKTLRRQVFSEYINFPLPILITPTAPYCFIILPSLYRLSHEEMSVLWEVIISVTLSKKKKKMYIYMCPIPNNFRNRAISLYRRATRYVLTRVAKCIDVDGGIFVNVL
jgi:hypothetical protein